MKDHILISDGEDPVTPLPSLSKRARKDPISTILISDSDPTPQKQPPESSSTPIFVPETPLSDDFSVVKCSFGSGALASNREDKFSGKRIISLDSEFEDSPQPEASKKYEPKLGDFRQPCRGLEAGSSEAYYKNTRIHETNIDDNTNWMHEVSFRSSLTNDTIEVDSDQEKENISVEKMGRKKKIRTTTHPGEALPKKQLSKEDKTSAMEEKKLRKEQEKLQKAALKAEEAERKKLEKEMKKWEKGKLALKSIVAEIDTKVVEGSIGGVLLSRFSEKGITIHVGPNPIERSIVWTMAIPEDIAPLLPQGSNIPYVLLVYEAEEFCNLVANEKFLENISRVQDRYPSYTVCCLTNKLMSYVKKREKEEYKNPGNWRRPPIDEVLAKLTTHYVKVHSRHCVDEAEVAEHVVGLTSSLASCQFRKKLTMLSVSANGALVSKDSVDRHLIKKSPWLKALVAIPKVQPRYALAVWKKYPSMKSLLKVYMDPNKSVHEKEFLLKELKVEGLVGGDIRLGEICSKRIYRVLMCASGAIKTDDVENGAAFFALSPELKHGSHKCVLTSPEIVADGICNICYKDEPVEFACDPCNYDLCKPCSKIPLKVSHDFHPEHPLEFFVREDDGKSTDMLCSGCGNLFTEPFYFKCKECKIYLDVDCALRKNIATGWDAEERLHYSHAHLIRRCKPGLKVKGSCSLCELPLSPSTICYACLRCYSFVHERCLDFPREIRHPVHPAHPLIRLDFTQTCGDGKDCDACGLHINGAPFGCPECNFNLHMRCADSLLRGLMHKTHEHRLFYAATGAQNVFGMEYQCQICMRGDVISLYFYYHCLECDMKFHFECLGIPESVFRKSYHIHPLVSKVLLLDDDSLEYCGVCETVVHTGHHAYTCEECDLVCHIECILREKEPSPLYLKDLYSCGNNMTTPTDGEDCEAKELLENKILFNDTDHTHVLTLGEDRGFPLSCYICCEDLLGIPWECKSCVFMAHDYCLKLQKPSRYRFHLNHLLTLLPCNPAMFPMSCDSCETTIVGFNLFCRICNYIICIECMIKANQFHGELLRGQKYIGTAEEKCLEKSHSLVEVMVSRTYLKACIICDERLCGKVLSCVICRDVYHPWCIELGKQERLSPLHPDHKLEMKLTSGSKCIACKLSIKRCGYDCSTCNVSFHVGCIEAVSISGKMKSHEHYLYNFWMDVSQFRRACSVCGKPCGASFYGCIDCNNFSAHVECIGFPTNVKNQQHQHIVVQSYSWCMMSCSLCGLDIKPSIHYSCNHCKDLFHVKCIMSMNEHEAATEEEQIKDIYIMYIERDLFKALYQHTSSGDEDSGDEDSDDKDSDDKDSNDEESSSSLSSR